MSGVLEPLPAGLVRFTLAFERSEPQRCRR